MHFEDFKNRVFQCEDLEVIKSEAQIILRILQYDQIDHDRFLMHLENLKILHERAKQLSTPHPKQSD